MANDDHVARLRGGVSTWNAWRRAHEGMTPDLRAASLRGLDLSGADLAHGDLRDCDLRGTILRNARLVGARLDGANVFKAVLDDADLQDAVLVGARFLNCSQIVVARNWQSARRDSSLACGSTTSLG